MKRIKQFQSLSREHHQSLLLAQKAIRTSESQDTEAVTVLCQEIVHDYPAVWKTHFKIEEDSIFKYFTGKEEPGKQAEIVKLCNMLHKEHLTMDAYYEKMRGGDYSVLGDFGALLKTHTRTEERQLFPLLEEVMTEKELNRVLQLSLKYRQPN